VFINGNKSQVSPAVRNAVTFPLERLTSLLLTGDAVSINRLKLLLLTAVLLTLQSWNTLCSVHQWQQVAGQSFCCLIIVVVRIMLPDCCLNVALLTLHFQTRCAVSINGTKSQVRLAVLLLPDHCCCAPDCCLIADPCAAHSAILNTLRSVHQR
jgi:NADH:ubiquinone oxidoreductase subunit K